MVQMKHFTAPQKMPNFQFSRRAKWPWRDKILGAPQRGQKIIVNQSKPILVIVSIKPFTRQSFRQNYFSREIEWAVFTETASRLIYPGGALPYETDGDARRLAYGCKFWILVSLRVFRAKR